WVASKDLGLEIREHANGAIAAGAANECLHPGIEPEPHQILCPALVLHPREAARELDLGIEDDGEASALQGLGAAKEPAGARLIRRCDNPDRVPLHDGRRTQQGW